MVAVPGTAQSFAVYIYIYMRLAIFSTNTLLVVLNLCHIRLVSFSVQSFIFLQEYNQLTTDFSRLFEGAKSRTIFIVPNYDGTW